MHLKDISSSLSTVLEPVVAEQGCFLVQVDYNPANHKLQVFVDGDEGVNIDKCSKISRWLSNWLDENDLISNKYTLEVSSPGIENPLKLRRQYVKNIGRKVRTLKTDGREFVGLLKEVNPDMILIEKIQNGKAGNKKQEKPEEPVAISFSEIKETKLIIST